jgi:hypothetical protein
MAAAHIDKGMESSPQVGAPIGQILSLPPSPYNDRVITRMI